MNQPNEGKFAATLEFLYSQLPMFQRIGEAAIKKGLTNTLTLCDFLGNPHHKFKSIHIGGTNGKGSVSNMLASVLQESGYKVGLYTSPHLRSFTERIRVDGNPVPDEEVVRFVEKVKPLIEQIKPSFFELTVAMAFDWFARSGVEMAVIEVGLGGGLDSTNIITPIVCAITNISFDHVSLLGNTLPLIAGEKAGIIKPGVPVLIGESHPETREVFLRKAREMNAEIGFADQQYQLRPLARNLDKQEFSVLGPEGIEGKVVTDLPGYYQQKNIPLVLAVLAQLNRQGIRIPATAMESGLINVRKNTGFRGRMDKLRERPLVICDVGHNEAGIREVVSQLSELKFSELHCVLGMAADKEVEKILPLFPPEAHFYFVKPDVPRGMDAQQLADIAGGMGLKGAAFGSVSAGYRAALERAGEEDLIFIGGSTFVVAEVV